MRATRSARLLVADVLPGVAHGDTMAQHPTAPPGQLGTMGPAERGRHDRATAQPRGVPVPGRQGDHRVLPGRAGPHPRPHHRAGPGPVHPGVRPPRPRLLRDGRRQLGGVLRRRHRGARGAGGGPGLGPAPRTRGRRPGRARGGPRPPRRPRHRRPRARRPRLHPLDLLLRPQRAPPRAGRPHPPPRRSRALRRRGRRPGGGVGRGARRTNRACTPRRRLAPCASSTPSGRWCGSSPSPSTGSQRRLDRAAERRRPPPPRPPPTAPGHLRLRRRRGRGRAGPGAQHRRRSPTSSCAPGCCATSARSTCRRSSSGAACRCPLVLAPTGFTRIADSQGELAVARAAARAGLPYSCRRWAPGPSRRWRPSPTDRSGSRCTRGRTAAS